MDKEFLEQMEDKAKELKSYEDFYRLARKYGFCYPGCGCLEGCRQE